MVRSNADLCSNCVRISCTSVGYDCAWLSCVMYMQISDRIDEYGAGYTREYLICFQPGNTVRLIAKQAALKQAGPFQCAFTQVIHHKDFCEIFVRLGNCETWKTVALLCLNTHWLQSYFPVMIMDEGDINIMILWFNNINMSISTLGGAFIALFGYISSPLFYVF